MKRIPAILLAIVLAILLCIPVCSAEDAVFTASAIRREGSEGVTVSGDVFSIGHNGYVCFPQVDLTGKRTLSAKIAFSHVNHGCTDGDAFAIRIDNPKVGDVLGYLILDEEGEHTYTAALADVSGVHDLYLYSSYCRSDAVITFRNVTVSAAAYTPALPKSVPDSAIVDNFHDTWVATDGLGRAVADYAEAGDVKPGEHEVGMMYWNWHTPVWSDPLIIQEVIDAYPEARFDYYHKGWSCLRENTTTLFWDEPVLGFYGSFDYFVYRRHAELLANIGVDAIFFDNTNANYIFLPALKVLIGAFRDAKAAGVDIPRLSSFTTNGAYDLAIEQAKALYLNCFQKDDCRDIWYYRDGKPMLLGEVFNAFASSSKTTEDEYLGKKITEFFTVRPHKDGWTWLEDYPQKRRGGIRDGRVEFMTLGLARNSSYTAPGTWCFNDPYAKGRSYTEGFGEDYRPEAKHQGYFMKEQMSRILAEDPTFCYIDGWNEFKTVRNYNYEGKFENGLVDLYDDENSRDIEPVKGDLRDDYYNLTADFIRKFKGVRKPPVASEPVTIDLSGALTQWDAVAPEYIGDNINYERDTTGYGSIRYTTEVINNVVRAKVARDADHYYFYAKTAQPIRLRENESFHLYLNTDRNHATGWEGYDFCVNLAGMGKVSAYENGAWRVVGDAAYTVSGDVLQMAIGKSLIGAHEAFEFKWADGAKEDGEILAFYQYGAVAPSGRFNYLYTETEETTLSSDVRKALSDTAVVAAGAGEMVVAGARMKVYEPDTRITATAANGTVYLPMGTFEEILGFGRTKVVYDTADNVVFIKTYELINDAIENDVFVYVTPGEGICHVNGRLTVLSAPVSAEDGRIYLPVTLLSEGFGRIITPLSDGAYAISKTAPDTAGVTAALAAIR